MSPATSSGTALRTTALKGVQVVVGLGLAVALVVWGVPFIGKTTWAEILQRISGISAWHLVVFFCLLMASLWCYTFLITGSLPGIDHKRALTVNLAATAVSNMLPAGGVVGIAATYMMCRSWGLPRRETSNSLIIAGVWNVLVRIAMPVLALLLLLMTDNTGLPNYVIQMTTIALVGGIGLVGLFIAAIIWDKAAALLGRLADQSLGVIKRRRGRGTDEPYVHRLREWQHHMSGVVFTRWFEMTAGMAGFFLFLFILFWECLSAVGVELSWQRMFVVYAIARLVTAFPLTPGSMGVAESVALAMLAGFGAGGAAATAGVMLFTLASVVAQIPLGGIAWLVWYLGPRKRGQGADDADGDDPDAGTAALRHPGEIASKVWGSAEGTVSADDARPAPDAAEAPPADGVPGSRGASRVTSAGDVG